MSCLAILSAVAFAALQQTERVERDERCLECHEDQGEAVKGSVHAAAGVGCVSCHGADEINVGQTRGNPHRRVATFRGYRRQNIPEDCGSCHVAVLDAMKPSGHFSMTKAGGDEPRRMKGCVECHTHHATPRARRSDIVTACARCHTDGTSELRDGRALFAALDALESDVARAAETAARRARDPGRNTRAFAAAQAGAASALAALRVDQHGVRFGSLEEARGRAAERLREAYSTLSAEDRAFERRWLWLLPFLALVALSYVLVRFKGRQLN